MSLQKRIFEQRYIVFIVLFSLFFFIFLVRLMFISTSEIGASVTTSTIITTDRGTIYDRNGRVLAISRETVTIGALLSAIKARDLAEQQTLAGQNKRPLNVMEQQQLDLMLQKKLNSEVEHLSSLLAIGPKEIFSRLYEASKYALLKRSVPVEVGNEIRKLNIPWISVDRSFKREYPLNNLLSQLLGFVDIDDEGIEGIELSFNELLKPKLSVSKRVHDKLNIGNSIYLTIDKRIQEVAENKLGWGMEKYEATQGIVIVSNPNTNEILALAIKPSYNNNFARDVEAKYHKNLAVIDSYEPGSVFKIFTEASLLNEELIAKDEKFMCNGSITLSGREIKCGKAHGLISFSEMLKYSCNVTAIKSIYKLGLDKYYGYLKAFGFGNKTEIDLPAESVGLLRDKAQLNTYNKSMMSFGYEIGITPIQLITAAGAVANGGYLYKPKLIYGKATLDGEIYERPEPELLSEQLIIKPEISKHVLQDMTKVLSEGGTAQYASISGINIAGKTGTAELYNREKGMYDPDLINTTFLGIFPAEKPQYIILVILKRPKGGRSASTVAVPVFREIVLEMLNYGIITKS